MEIVDLSRYEGQETLGKGGMGEVLLATDTRLNRKVAIKRRLGDAAKSQTAGKRFLTEAQPIAALNHFNIVQIHDYGTSDLGYPSAVEFEDGRVLVVYWFNQEKEGDPELETRYLAGTFFKP